MDHFRQIYAAQAVAYQAMIAREDAAGRLWPALQAIVDWPGRSVLDLGAGTGRLAQLAAAVTGRWLSLDIAAAMLREQARQRARLAGGWDLVQADMRRLPLAPAGFDIVSAGWALGHFCGWYGAEWPAQIGRVLAEMDRLARPGATLIILETMGTGTAAAGPPTPALAAYYEWLVAEWGFRQQVIVTDYEFASAAEAAELTGFFFGAALAQKVLAEDRKVVSEWTGIWWRPV